MAGAGYRLFNTGDVLTAQQVNEYLQQQVIMRFASSAARTSALSGVLAEGMASWLDDTNSFEIYNGTAWVSASGDLTGLTAGTGITITDPTGPVPTITNDVATEFDTKGDLIVGTGADTFDKLVAGGNGETLVADSSTTTGLRYQSNFAAGKNLLINGDFNIWQRGTTFTNPSFADYTADRWRNTNYNVAPTTYSITRETFTPGAAPVSGYEGRFFFRSTLTTIGSNTEYDTCSQRIEGVLNSGQSVTVSFYAKSDSNRTQNFLMGQNYGSGGSGDSTIVSSTNFSTTTAWQRFTFSGSVVSASGKTIGTSPYAYLRIRQASASGSVLDVWGFQVEYGSVATAFQTATGTLAGELAACQRYYIKFIGDSANDNLGITGFGSSTTQAVIPFVFPTPMRISATAIESSLVEVTDLVNEFAITITLGVNRTPLLGIANCAATGLTQFRPYFLRNDNDATGYVAFTAEL